jgi:hypothetical protein
MYAVNAWATVLTCCLGTSTLVAQSIPATTADSAPSAAATPAPGYLPPTANERWNDYVHSVVGPLAFIKPAVSAGLGTLGGSPRFWEKDPGGFGQRFGTAIAARTVDETVKASLSAVLHEDNTYRPCSCRSVFARAGHALITSVVAMNDNGHPVPAFGRIAGAYAGAFTTSAFYQHEYGVDGALRLGTGALAGHAVTNIVREFIGPIF